MRLLCTWAESPCTWISTVDIHPSVSFMHPVSASREESIEVSQLCYGLDIWCVCRAHISHLVRRGEGDRVGSPFSLSFGHLQSSQQSNIYLLTFQRFSCTCSFTGGGQSGALDARWKCILVDGRLWREWMCSSIPTGAPWIPSNPSYYPGASLPVLQKSTYFVLSEVLLPPICEAPSPVLTDAQHHFQLWWGCHRSSLQHVGSTNFYSPLENSRCC